MPTRTPLLLRQLRWAVRVLAALSLGVVLTLSWRAKNERVSQFDLEAGPDFWRASGFVEMVPPLRLPGRASPELETHVWLRLPEHALLGITGDPRSGRPLLHYPEGAEAVRVEVARGKSVADARGARFSALEAQRFYVLRPRASGAVTALHGFSWSRADEPAGTAAAQLIAEFSRGSLDSHRADAAAALARAQSACVRCHVPARADSTDTSDLAAVRRGTDGAGLFQIQTVLADHAPLESYAPRELNAADPDVEVRCGDGPASLQTTKHGASFSCPSQLVPVGYLDVSRGVQMGDGRVLALCRARRYLYEHLEPAGRAAFAAAFRVCGI